MCVLYFFNCSTILLKLTALMKDFGHLAVHLFHCNKKAAVFTTPCTPISGSIQRLESQDVSLNSDNMDRVAEFTLAPSADSLLLSP